MSGFRRSPSMRLAVYIAHVLKGEVVVVERRDGLSLGAFYGYFKERGQQLHIYRIGPDESAVSCEPLR